MLKALLALIGLTFAMSCSVGPTCGPFPIPSDMVLTQNSVPPIYKVGYQTFATYDPSGPAFPNEVVITYGIPYPYPTTIGGVGLQVGFELYCPITGEQAAHAPLADLFGIPIASLEEVGIPLPYATSAVVPNVKWPLYVHINGAQEYSLEMTSVLQNIASQGVCVLAAQAHPGDLTIFNFQVFNISAPNEPIAMRARIDSVYAALDLLETRSKTHGDPLYNALRFDKTICSGGSVGGEICQCAANGCPRFSIPKTVPARFVFNNMWDPSGDIYINATDFQGYNFPQVTVHSQNTGDTLGMSLRGQRMNLIPSPGVNSVVLTKGTVHEMGVAIHACQLSQIAVSLGYFGNLAKYAEPNYWCYPNQTLWCFCAPAPYNNADKPFTPLQTFVNILLDVAKISVVGVEGGPIVQESVFSVIAFELLQNTSYDGQKYFTYYGNQIVGNATLGGFEQELLFNNANFFYGYSSDEGLESFDSTNTNNNGGNYGNFFHNYADCVRNGGPCKVFAYNTTCAGNPCQILPQPPRWLLESYGVCPGGLC